MGFIMGENQQLDVSWDNMNLRGSMLAMPANHGQANHGDIQDQDCQDI